MVIINMYSFLIKDNGPDLDIIITRSMLALAAIAAIVYRSDDYYYLSLVASFVLIFPAFFIKMVLVKWRISKMVLLSVSAILLFIATRSIAFAIILLVYGWLVKFLIRKPAIEFTNKGIKIKKLLISPAYQWSEFANIILKDNLLTLDFKNNRLIQVNVDNPKSSVDEIAFNEFCKGFI